MHQKSSGRISRNPPGGTLGENRGICEIRERECRFGGLQNSAAGGCFRPRISLLNVLIADFGCAVVRQMPITNASAETPMPLSPRV